jgi:hypothetical protein
MAMNANARSGRAYSMKGEVVLTDGCRGETGWRRNAASDRTKQNSGSITRCFA